MKNNTLDSIPQNEWDRLIYSILKPFYSFCKNDALITPEDLNQEAWIGLLAACDRYDPTKAKFVTYAYHYIRGHIMRYISKKTQNKPDMVATEDTTECQHMFCTQSETLIKDIERKDLSDTIFAKVKNEEHTHLLIEHFIYNKSFRQLAEEHNVSYETIRVRIQKLLDLLDVRLQHENS